MSEKCVNCSWNSDELVKFCEACFNAWLDKHTPTNAPAQPLTPTQQRVVDFYSKRYPQFGNQPEMRGVPVFKSTYHPACIEEDHEDCGGSYEGVACHCFCHMREPEDEPTPPRDGSDEALVRKLFQLAQDHWPLPGDTAVFVEALAAFERILKEKAAVEYRTRAREEEVAHSGEVIRELQARAESAEAKLAEAQQELDVLREDREAVKAHRDALVRERNANNGWVGGEDGAAAKLARVEALVNSREVIDGFKHDMGRSDKRWVEDRVDRLFLRLRHILAGEHQEETTKTKGGQ